MVGGNFLSRVVSYVVNELVVDTLAHNREFQRFAVRTSRKMEDLSNKALQKSQELTEQIEGFSKNLESSKNR